MGQPEPWQVVPTRTTPAAVPEPAPTGAFPSLRRSHALAVTVTAALVVLLALGAWALRNSKVDHAEPSVSSSPTAVKATPPAPAIPVAPAPRQPEAPATHAAPERPADNGKRPASRKAKKGPRNSVKFTPEGVPII